MTTNSTNELSYSQAGVNRSARAEAKNFGLFSFAGEVKTPFNNLFALPGSYLGVLCVDGVGTKVLLAQLANDFRTIGIDGVATVANDCIRCGAKPLAIADVLDVHHSDRNLIAELMKGIKKSSDELSCPIVGGETADVPELSAGVSDNPFQFNFACFGAVEKSNLIDGRSLHEGDALIALPSSGVHSNGLSLARKALLKKWGGAFESEDKPSELNGKTVLSELLTPTRLYVKPFLAAASAVKIKAAVHVTGDAFLKFKEVQKFSNAGFEIEVKADGIPPVFQLIHDAAGKLDKSLSWREMFSTFNMGLGFVFAVDKNDAATALQVLKKAGAIDAFECGRVVGEKKISVKFGKEEIIL